MADVLRIEGFLDGAALARLRREMRSAEGGDAGVLGRQPGERVPSTARRATRVDVPDAARAAVLDGLERERPRIAAHFGRDLDACEEPQFLRYGRGDYFVAHQDGNTPLLHDDSRFRKVSVVVVLSEPASYAGGALVIHDRADRTAIKPDPGTLVAYPSETTHEVTPITDGERLSIVSWYRAGAESAEVAQRRPLA